MIAVAIINASCPSCGEVRVPAADATLVLCVNARHLTKLVFTCPDCEVLHERGVTPAHTELLRGAQVPLVTWKVPAEALEPHRGPVICHDDVLDFALADLDVALQMLRERAA